MLPVRLASGMCLAAGREPRPWILGHVPQSLPAGRRVLRLAAGDAGRVGQVIRSPGEPPPAPEARVRVTARRPLCKALCQPALHCAYGMLHAQPHLGFACELEHRNGHGTRVAPPHPSSCGLDLPTQAAAPSPLMGTLTSPAPP